eukprot:TRINITY_DN2864_c0_g1_i1.p1 TRINITY_DN2864_c0_g1~~TRINITY_DN2864_c0_g1_i1.p1  ORF type:complete len:264 (-),score=24.36 TRINITY_DN2864_c0_g1_i1:263-1054(-)
MNMHQKVFNPRVLQTSFCPFVVSTLFPSHKQHQLSRLNSNHKCRTSSNSNEVFQSVDREGSELVVKESEYVQQVVDRMINEIITIEMDEQQSVQLSRFLVWMLNPYIQNPFVLDAESGSSKMEWLKLLLQPIEMLNGRMAILGLSSVALIEIIEGRSISEQFQVYWLGPWLAFVLIVAITILRQWFWTNPMGFGIFTRNAELWSGRAAMFWFAVMAAYEAWATNFGGGQIPVQYFYLLGQFLASEGQADCEMQAVLWGCGVAE